METAIVHWGHIGKTEKKVETTLVRAPSTSRNSRWSLYISVDPENRFPQISQENA